MAKNTPFSAPEQVHLILNYRPLGLVRATARKLDDGTMVVDTGCILLPPHAELEMTVSYRIGGQNHVHRFAAEVMSARPGETRLRFDTGDQQAAQFVRQLAQRTPPARTLAGVVRSLAPEWTSGAALAR